MNKTWMKLSKEKIAYMVSNSMLKWRLERRRVRKSFVDKGVVKFEREGEDIRVYVNDRLVANKCLYVANSADWNRRIQMMFDTILAMKGV